MKDKVATFATVDPFEGMTEASPGHAQNLAGGQWVSVAQLRDDIVDPMNGRRFLEFGPRNAKIVQDSYGITGGLRGDLASRRGDRDLLGRPIDQLHAEHRLQLADRDAERRL